MTTRRVILTLEVETDAPLPVLRRAGRGGATFTAKGASYSFRVIQAQANVVKDSRTGG